MSHSESTTRASAYVHKGQLCVMGIHETELGPVPFAISTTIEGEAPEGAVDPHQAPDNVKEALANAEIESVKEIKRGKLKLAVESLVLRSRQGDQNATALLMAIRENAAKGNERAKLSFELAKKFALTRKPQTVFGLERMRSENPYERAAAISTFGATLDPSRLYAILANGPDLSNQRDMIRDALEEEFRPTFMVAYSLCQTPGKLSEVSQDMNKEHFDIARIGYLTGRAHILQCVRKGAPVSLMSARAGWELGE